MEALFETFMIGGIIGGGAYLLLSWLDSDKNSEEDDKGIYNSKALEQKQPDDWFNKIESKDRHGWKVSWVDPKTGSVKSHEEYRSGYIPHNSWYVANALSTNDVERFLSTKDMKNFDEVYKHPTNFIKDYKDWKRKAIVGQNTVKKAGKYVTKDVTQLPQSEISLSMLDFFRHHHYNEFEANQGIDLKTSKLEMIEIYELYKAYLLLNHNIKVIDPSK